MNGVSLNYRDGCLREITAHPAESQTPVVMGVPAADGHRAFVSIAIAGVVLYLSPRQAAQVAAGLVEALATLERAAMDELTASAFEVVPA